MPPIPSSVFNVFNVVVFGVILFGVAVHRRRELHQRIMLACCVADLLMVLLIEVQRHAIEQAVGTASGLLRFHVVVSVAVLLLWGPQIAAGHGIMRGKPYLRRHRLMAWAFLAFRATNLATAFMVSR